MAAVDRYTPEISPSLLPENEFLGRDDFGLNEPIQNSVPPKMKYKKGIHLIQMPKTEELDGHQKMFGLLSLPVGGEVNTESTYRINEGIKIYQSNWESCVTLRGDFSKTLKVGNQIGTKIIGGDQYAVDITLNLKPDGEDSYRHSIGHTYPRTSPTKSHFTGIASEIAVNPVTIEDDMDLYKYSGSLETHANSTELSLVKVYDWRQGSGGVERSDMKMSFKFIKDKEPGKLEQLIDLEKCSFSMLDMVTRDNFKDYIDADNCIEVRPTDFTEENLLEPYFKDPRNVPIKVKIPSFITDGIDISNRMGITSGIEYQHMDWNVNWDWITYVRGKDGCLTMDDMLGASFSTNKTQFITSLKDEYMFTTGQSLWLLTLGGLLGFESPVSSVRMVSQAVAFSTYDLIGLFAAHNRAYATNTQLGIGNGAWVEKGDTYGPLWKSNTVSFSTKMLTVENHVSHCATMLESFRLLQNAMDAKMTDMKAMVSNVNVANFRRSLAAQKVSMNNVLLKGAAVSAQP